MDTSLMRQKTFPSIISSKYSIKLWEVNMLILITNTVDNSERSVKSPQDPFIETQSYITVPKQISKSKFSNWINNSLCIYSYQCELYNWEFMQREERYVKLAEQDWAATNLTHLCSLCINSQNDLRNKSHEVLGN